MTGGTAKTMATEVTLVHRDASAWCSAETTATTGFSRKNGIAHQMTPSEVTFLNGAPRRPIERGGVLRQEILTPTPGGLVASTLKAAFLADQERGAVEFQMRREKVFFGLITREHLFVVPKDRRANWPSSSLEGALRTYGPRRVSDIIHNWLGENSTNAWGSAGMLIMDHLVRRCLVERLNVERKVFRFFTVNSTCYDLPEETLAALQSNVTRAGEPSLARCWKELPNSSDDLDREIRDGVGRRQIETNSWD